MSGIAEVLLNLGYEVSGSDLHRSPMTDRLRRLGASVHLGHNRMNLGEAQVVVVSSAVSANNPEVLEARRSEIPVIARAEMLAELMRMKYGVAIAGSHGKTSTTSLIAQVMTEGGLDPTVVIGGRLIGGSGPSGSGPSGSGPSGSGPRSGARLGRGEFLVAEADESDGSFLHLNPTIAVITNIDPEHLDHYGDFEALKRTFAEFAGKIPFYGTAIFCADHPVVRTMARRFERRHLTYGLSNPGADITARRIRRFGLGSEFEVLFRGERLGVVRLPCLVGRHNVLNSLAAVAVAEELGIRFSAVRRAFQNFKGISRRFEVIRSESPVIVDDYGHHPVEIRATLRAARQLWPRRRIWALFQPHRYSRTKLLLNDFGKAFVEADRVLTTGIYAAGERPIPGVSGLLLSRKIRGARPGGARFCETLGVMQEILLREIGPNDVVLTLGAGDIWKVGKELARRWDS